MNKKWKVLGHTALLAAAGLMVGLNLYLWNAGRLMGNALPMPFGYGAAVVLTGSMEPALPADSLIFIRAGQEFGVGDVVVYQNGAMPVVHRITAIDGDQVTAKGDANNAPDAPIPRDRIRGVVLGHIPGVGALVRLLRTPAATLALIGAAVWLAEASFRKEREKDREELEKIKEEIRRLKDQQ